jgi:hypothetical protein
MGEAAWLRELFIVFADFAESELPWEITSLVRQLDYSGTPWLTYNDAAWAGLIPDAAYRSSVVEMIRVLHQPRVWQREVYYKIARERSPVLYVKWGTWKEPPLSEDRLTLALQAAEVYNRAFTPTNAKFITEIDLYRRGDEHPRTVEASDLPVLRLWWD